MGHYSDQYDEWHEELLTKVNKELVFGEDYDKIDNSDKVFSRLESLCDIVESGVGETEEESYLSYLNNIEALLYEVTLKKIKIKQGLVKLTYTKGEL